MNPKIKRTLKSAASRTSCFKPILEQIFQTAAWISTRLASYTHRGLMAIQWGFPPQPEHFDHHIDLFYNWLETRNSLWVERGVFGGLALHGGDVLELACGDGFNTKNFYSLRSQHIVACDFDPKAIETAKRKNRAPNIEYVLADIRTAMPHGKYENIVWDTAIEHFTPDEIDMILKDILLRLRENGVLSGYTIVERPDGKKSLSHHEYEFKSKEDLLRFFTPHFKAVTVFETIYPSRHNLYFWASRVSGVLPFRGGWPHVVSV